MKILRSCVFLLIGLSFLVPNLARAALVPDEQFSLQPPVPVGDEFSGYTRFVADDSQQLGDWSYLIGLKYKDNDYGKEKLWGQVCKSIEDPQCNGATDFIYTAVYDVCSKDTDSNCIVSLQARIDNGPYIKGVVTERIAPKYDFAFTGNTNRGVPNGSTPSIWKFPGIKHDGGDEFLLSVKAVKMNVGTGWLYPVDISGGVQPVSRKSGIFSLPKFTAGKPFNSLGQVWGADYGKFGNCIIVLSEAACALPWPHPGSISYKLEIRVPKRFDYVNFIHGRLSEPQVSLISVSSLDEIFSIEAKPISTPFINAWRKNSEISPELNKTLAEQFRNGGGYEGCSKLERDLCNFVVPPIQFTDEGLKNYALWLKEFGDKSTGTKTMWAFKTLSENTMWRVFGSNDCTEKAESIAGVVATNANIYDSAPPFFNKKTNTLDYKVSSPHFDAVGKPNSGSYDLIISEVVARCLYGLASAPIKAEVSVIGGESENQIATSSFSSKNGFLVFTVKGFGYSSPVLRIKLSESSSKTVTSNPKKTIFCTNGKLTKKVSGTNPKCPTGYKKK